MILLTMIAVTPPSATTKRIKDIVGFILHSVLITFVYAAIGDPMPKASGIVKLDLSLANRDQQDCIVACHMFEPGCYGGEPFFRAREPDSCSTEEDDGYLVSYLHDEKTEESRFLVMDAKSPNLEVVAAVKLPRRVPYGFHGLFIKESDLKKL